MLSVSIIHYFKRVSIKIADSQNCQGTWNPFLNKHVIIIKYKHFVTEHWNTSYAYSVHRARSQNYENDSTEFLGSDQIVEG
jgi:hypothetical protein